MDSTDREPRTWFITDAGSGTALALTRTTVGRGDNVVALVSRADELTSLTDVHHGQLRVIAADIGDQTEPAVGVVLRLRVPSVEIGIQPERSVWRFQQGVEQRTIQSTVVGVKK